MYRMTSKKKYAFLDRDGTLIFEPQDTFQIDSLEKLQVLEGAIQGLIELKNQGYGLVMVTNQDGLGTQSFPAADFEIPHQAMLKQFKDAGIHFERIFICPHTSQDHCACRKPKTGLVDSFLAEHSIDRTASFVCGDRDSDRQLADNIGIEFIPTATNSNFYEALKHAGII